MDVVEQIEAVLNRATQDFDGRDGIMQRAADEIKRLRALAERAGGGGKQDAIDFLYKHGALTHVAAREAVELLTSNGFEISRRSK